MPGIRHNWVLNSGGHLAVISGQVKPSLVLSRWGSNTQPEQSFVERPPADISRQTGPPHPGRLQQIPYRFRTVGRYTHQPFVERAVS